jgi:formamidopyrimidine-DNA glycosylase
VVASASTPRLHDHVDLALDDGRSVRFNDPRRFGCLLWQPVGSVHPLLQGMGPEPLPPAETAEDAVAFDGDYLYSRSRGRKVAVKAFLMDQRIVVGVGNIYVAEALFAAGIAPQRAAGRISRERYRVLAAHIVRILQAAITRGGTTLRDFISPDGAPGYFEQELSVYGRDGQDCRSCGRPLRHAWLGQRATVWCAHCQR